MKWDIFNLFKKTDDGLYLQPSEQETHWKCKKCGTRFRHKNIDCEIIAGTPCNLEAEYKGFQGYTSEYLKLNGGKKNVKSKSVRKCK